MQAHTVCHPGEVIRDVIGEMKVGDFAKHLELPRESVSRVLNGKRAVTPAMAIRLAQVFPNTDAETWLRLQMQYDLWLEGKKKVKKLKPLQLAEAA